jgi:hypothetical protein
MPYAVHYIPILTTVLSAWFGTHLFLRWRERPERAHHGWWAFGVYIYGLGTLAESMVTLWGWSPGAFRLWYVTGALLGGAPLAQGSVYFHFKRATANRMSAVLVTYLVAATVCVMLVPIDMALVTPHGLSGKVMVWKWVRMLSPIVNLYAVVFLIGGAVRSAVKHWRRTGTRALALGNAWIALGALLPGIGGSFSRAGHTEVLYVLECIGLLFIWRGYRLCTGDERVPATVAAEVGETA